jgi:hypothetical protein
VNVEIDRRRPLAPLVSNAYGVPDGQLAEWSKAHAWKVCRRGTVSRVRIPHCPPIPIEFIQNFTDLAGLPNLVPNEEKMLGLLGRVQNPDGPPGLSP